MIWGLLALFAILVSAVYFAYRQGRKTQDGENDSEILDDIRQADILRDRLNHDAEFRARVRDRFQR